MLERDMSFSFETVIIVAYISTVFGFDFPPKASDVALYSRINSSSTCCQGPKCTGRTAFPSLDTPLTQKGKDCDDVIDSVPKQISIDNGSVKFNQSTTTCTEVEKLLYPGTNNSFTLSFWVKALCSSEWLVEIVSRFYLWKQMSILNKHVQVR